MIRVPLFLLQIFLSAVVMRDAWLWFVVPLGMPPLTLAHACGLDRMISWVVLIDIDTHLMASHYLKYLSKELTPGIKDVLRIVVTLMLYGGMALTHWLMTLGW